MPKRVRERSVNKPKKKSKEAGIRRDLKRRGSRNLKSVRKKREDVKKKRNANKRRNAKK